MPSDYSSVSIYSQAPGTASSLKCHSNIAGRSILLLVKVVFILSDSLGITFTKLQSSPTSLCHPAFKAPILCSIECTLSVFREIPRQPFSNGGFCPHIAPLSSPPQCQLLLLFLFQLLTLHSSWTHDSVCIGTSKGIASIQSPSFSSLQPWHLLILNAIPGQLFLSM